MSSCNVDLSVVQGTQSGKQIFGEQKGWTKTTLGQEPVLKGDRANFFFCEKCFHQTWLRIPFENVENLNSSVAMFVVIHCKGQMWKSWYFNKDKTP